MKHFYVSELKIAQINNYLFELLESYYFYKNYQNMLRIIFKLINQIISLIFIIKIIKIRCSTKN
jgi:hypothetical protein